MESDSEVDRENHINKHFNIPSLQHCSYDDLHKLVYKFRKQVVPFAPNIIIIMADINYSLGKNMDPSNRNLFVTQLQERYLLDLIDLVRLHRSNWQPGHPRSDLHLI